MRNLWCLEKISILPFIISATGIVPQSFFKNLKILDLENTLVVEIQKGNEKNVVTQSRTDLQIYEGRDDQLNRPGPMA
jgi:hypothetical protein